MESWPCMGLYAHMCFILDLNRQKKKGKDWIWHGDIERYFQKGVGLLCLGETVWATKSLRAGKRRMFSKEDRAYYEKVSLINRALRHATSVSGNYALRNKSEIGISNLHVNCFSVIFKLNWVGLERKTHLFWLSTLQNGLRPGLTALVCQCCGFTSQILLPDPTMQLCHFQA